MFVIRVMHVSNPEGEFQYPPESGWGRYDVHSFRFSRGSLMGFLEEQVYVLKWQAGDVLDLLRGKMLVMSGKPIRKMVRHLSPEVEFPERMLAELWSMIQAFMALLAMMRLPVASDEISRRFTDADLTGLAADPPGGKTDCFAPIC